MINHLIARIEKLEKSIYSQKTILNLAELSAYTGLSKSYLYKLTSKAEIPHYKPSGKVIFFEKQQIDSWIKRNKVESNENIDAKASSILIAGGGHNA